MKELVEQIREIDREIDQVVPLLVADDGTGLEQMLQQLFQKLTAVFQRVVGMPELVAQLDVSAYMKSLECFVYAAQVWDTIQLADVLLYELRGMFHNIYELYEGRENDE